MRSVSANLLPRALSRKWLPSCRKQLPIGDHRVPWADHELYEDTGLVEWVAFEQLFRFFLARRFVDDERSRVVGERAGRRDLPLFFQAHQVLAMCGTHLGGLCFVLEVFDYGGEFHGCTSRIRGRHGSFFGWGNSLG